MSYKEQLQKDLDFTYLYLGETALYQNKDLKVLFEDNSNFEYTEGKFITARVSELELINEGDEITINNEFYKVHNYDYKDELNLEWNVEIIKND